MGNILQIRNVDPLAGGRVEVSAPGTGPALAGLHRDCSARGRRKIRFSARMAGSRWNMLSWRLKAGSTAIASC